MKRDISEALKISSLFVSSGLIICIILSLLLFGKGLQFILPFLILPVFIVISLLSESIPFFRKHPILKFILLMLAVVGFVIVI